MAKSTEPMNFEEMPPPAVLYQLATGYYVSRALYIAARLSIADHLSGGPRSADELAAATATHAPSLRRVLRLLVSKGVFAEGADGAFALTPLSEWLRSGMPSSFRSAALLFTGPLEWTAWGDLLHTVQTGEVALEHVLGFGTFEYLEKHPDESAVFDEAMAAFTSLTAMAVAAVYDLTPFRTLVDVGGGNGALLIGLLKANPHLHGIVYDLPRTAEGAAKQITAAALTERCEAVGGDFFASVPAGGDAYIIKHVIHDWDDDRATQILKNCHRAMQPGTKLLIVEGVYPEHIDQSLASQGATLNDVNMLVVTGGRQRSADEFRSLFRNAGFELERIVPTMAAACVVEGERV
jgi:hypothetical protein